MKDKKNIMGLGNDNISAPFLVGAKRRVRKMKKTLIILTIISFASLIFSGMSFAAVCSDCHTMHNMQDGTSITGGDPTNSLLVASSCLACHTGTNTGSNSIPYVMGSSEPTFGTNTLAGGNFWWVENDSDAKGHNVITANTDGTLSAAPGASSAGCGTPNCHAALNVASCEGCHMSPAHHTASSGNVTAAPWYRWLSGHQGGAGLGVKGIEHSGWGYGATAGGTNHNEYLGNVDDKDSAGGFAAVGSTMTGFCTGCHGNFHIQDATATGATPWTRHPSDFVILNSGEYASMSTSYNPNTPVARPAGFNWAGAVGVATVAAGTDMVMCLSCHVAHGSPYDDMLRWNYDTMEVGGGSNTSGCFVCHTSKDGVSGS